jgi:hypothetical protein
MREVEIEWQHSVAMWDAMRNQKPHPELRDGERFVRNTSIIDIDSLVLKKNERVGKVAYDIHGNVLERLVPVFKKVLVLSEIEKAVRGF